MDMTDNDDIMLEGFFKQAAQQQIEDDGFTERVMYSLPDHQSDIVRKMSRLWTWFCVILSVALFFVFGGLQVFKAAAASLLQMLATTLEVFVATAPTAEIPVNPWVILLVLVFVLVYLPYQTARKLSAIL